MSLEPADIQAEGYCDVRDVVNEFDRFSMENVDENSELVDRIQRKISAKSSEIDSQTSHAWRERRVVNEFKNLENVYRWNTGIPVYLTQRDIRTPLDSEKGDKVEIWRGNRYTDLVADDSFSEGRDEDYWVEEGTGVLYLYRRTLFQRHRQLRLTYRFGKEKVPAIIQDVCAQLVAADLMETDFYRYTTPGNDEAPNAENVADNIREQAKRKLEPYKEVRSTGLS